MRYARASLLNHLTSTPAGHLSPTAEDIETLYQEMINMGEEAIAIFAFSTWLIAMPVLGALIGAKKGSVLFCAFLGLLLGPIGVLLALAYDGNIRKPCPFCKEKVHKEAIACPHCQRDLPAMWSSIK